MKRHRRVTAAGTSPGAPSPVPRAGAFAAGLPARRTALEILGRVERTAAFADVLLGNRLAPFTPPDRRLVTQLVLGTIAWRARLDYELAALSSRKLDTVSPEVLVILRLGLFQLRFLNRIPPHAVVDTAVTLASEDSATARAGGFVNAVLRRAAAAGPVALPARDADEPGWLALAYSHPRWLAERFVQWFGTASAEALMAANNTAAANVIRLNLARGSREAIVARLAAEGIELEAGSRRLTETAVVKGAPPFETAAYREGLIHVQSEASQLVARMLAPARGGAVADCAAAPGGKTTHLAEVVGLSGRVIAIDINLAGLKRVRALVNRLGHHNVDIVRADMTVAPPLKPAAFDYVLLDAPCTGLGTMREHPEIRWRLKPDDFRRMAQTQLRMLENSASLLKPGGVMVYSVCSLAPEEGEGVTSEFLDRRRNYAVERRPPDCAALDDLAGADGFMRTRPDDGGLDGFFAARFRRVE